MQDPWHACLSWIKDQEEELGCLYSGMCSKGGVIFDMCGFVIMVQWQFISLWTRLLSSCSL